MSDETGGVGRSIGAVVAGIVVAVVGVFAIEALGQVVYPPPPGLDLTKPESIKAMMKNIPVGALLFVLLAMVVGTAAGGGVAARIAPRKPVLHAMIVGVVLLAFGVMNLVAIPHPTWFAIVNVLTFLPAAYVGALAGRRT